MADHFGGKWLYGGAVLTLSVVSLLTPTAARIHIGVLIALQVSSGLGKGVMMPASHALIARWSAPQYRSAVVTVLLLGIDAGVTAGMFMAGVLCDYGFAGGWPSVFYVFGVVGCVWSVAWNLLCYDSPATHPGISAAERRYWETTIGSTDLESHPPTPWLEILTSVPVWALAVLHCSDVWGYSTLMICLPLYMHDVLGVNTTRNGAFSALPFAVSMVAGPASGLLADWLRTRLSTTIVRKLICVVSYTPICCLLILVGYIGCDRALAVAIICIVTSCAAVGFSVIGVNQLDLAPLHAGKIIGLTYSVANVGAIAAPHVVGAITYERSTRSEWQKVFFIMAANYLVGMVVYVIFGSGERQSWADDISRDPESRDPGPFS